MTYDAHVADSQTTITKTLKVAGAALDSLTGATFSVRVTNPSGVVETWTAGFTGGAAGLLTFVTPTDAYWDEVGTWTWDVRYTLGGVSQTADPITLSVGPSGYVPTAGGPGAAVNYDYPAADADSIVHLYVNDATGDDDNIGDSSAPLATMAAALLRLERWTLWGRDQEFAIHDASGASYAEDLRLKLPVPPRRRVSIVGDESGQTVLASGTMSAGSAVGMTDAGATWGVANQYAGRIVRIQRAGVTIANPEIREHTGTAAIFCEANPAYTFANGDTYEILRPITRIDSFSAVLPWSSARVQALGFHATTDHGPLLHLAHIEFGPGVVNEKNENCALLLSGGETVLTGCCVVGSTDPSDFTPYGLRVTAGARVSAGMNFSADADPLMGIPAGGSYLYFGCGLRCDTGTFGLHLDDGNFTGSLVCLDTGIRVGASEGVSGSGSPSGSQNAFLDMRSGAVFGAVGLQVRGGVAVLGANTEIRFAGMTGTTPAVRVYERGTAIAMAVLAGDLARDVFLVEGGRLHVRTGALTIDGTVVNYGVNAWFGALCRIAPGAVTVTGALGGAYSCDTGTTYATDVQLTTAAPLIGPNSAARIFRSEFEP